MQTSNNSCLGRNIIGSRTHVVRNNNNKKSPHIPHAANSKHIELIVSDVDGTLLNSKQQLSSKVQQAVETAHNEAGVPLIVATGKAIGPWVKEVLPRLPQMPQIFLQGLLIRDAEGNIIYSRQLEEDVIHDAIDFAETSQVQIVAYLGDRIVCSQTDEHSDRLNFYKEPPPESIGSLKDHVGKLPIMKLIFMAEQSRIDELRPSIETLFKDRSSLTTAIPGMLEVLPFGASKGAALRWLLPQLGVNPDNALALGDGENDVEMLKLCGLGVAVGNAHPPAREAADVVVSSNDEDGVAEAIETFVLQPRGLKLVEEEEVVVKT